VTVRPAGGQNSTAVRENKDGVRLEIGDLCGISAARDARVIEEEGLLVAVSPFGDYVGHDPSVVVGG
jgi:hypothetical protein